MTREEAIRILDPATAFEALAAYEYFGGLRGKRAAAAALREANEMALAALKAQEGSSGFSLSEISRLKALIGEEGQELWSAENQRADRLQGELEKMRRRADTVAKVDLERWYRRAFHKKTPLPTKTEMILTEFVMWAADVLKGDHDKEYRVNLPGPGRDRA